MNVIITGGTRGIGRATAKLFEREGWGVFVTGSSRDIRNPKQCKYIAEDCMREYGSIDCLVNNAGIVRNKLLISMTQDEWQDVIDVNLTGAFNMTKACLPYMLNGGSIVNVTSISGIMGFCGQANYSASKAGLIGLTRALSKELAPMNIRVNAVAPGIIDTDMTHELLDKGKGKLKDYVPLGRPGKPEDVAERIFFLANSDYINGNVDRIDGGWAAGSEG